MSAPGVAGNERSRSSTDWHRIDSKDGAISSQRLLLGVRGLNDRGQLVRDNSCMAKPFFSCTARRAGGSGIVVFSLAESWDMSG